jgi:hypothetical protein
MFVKITALRCEFRSIPDKRVFILRELQQVQQNPVI